MIQQLLVHYQCCTTITPKRNPVPIKQSFSIPPALALTTPICFLAKTLPILGILWNHTICGLLCLASFTWHNVFRVYSCCSVCQYFLHFYGRIIFHHMNVVHFVYLFIG